MEPNTLTDSIRLPQGSLRPARTLFGLLAVVGLALSVVGLLTNREQAVHSWLTAYLFFLTIALGGLFFVMLQHLTRAGWSVVVRRMAETAAWTVPLFAILFLPIVFGMKDLYHWTHAEEVAHDALLQHKQGFLNEPFFFVRAAVYFLVWSVLGIYFYRTSVGQDRSGDPAATVTMQRRAAPGMILFAFTLTFMGFDWVMSLDPHWYSTIFGVYIFSGMTLGVLSFMTLVTLLLRRSGHLTHIIRIDHFQDLGRLIFAFSVFWAYIAFSQFMLIWYGNIPEETIFYLHRVEGTWMQASLLLGIGHFLVPFALLMSRWTKRRPALVAAIAVWVLAMHYLDLYWLVMPNLHHHDAAPHWLDLATLAGIGGAFLWVFTTRFGGEAVVPAGDPRLPESLALEHLY